MINISSPSLASHKAARPRRWIVGALLVLPVLCCSGRPDPEFLKKRAAEIRAGLTLEQKVGQLLHIAFAGPKASPAILSAVRRIQPGGVILFGHNLERAEQIRRLNGQLQDASIRASGIPLLVSTDQEGGRVFRVPEDVAPRFPGAMALGQANDPQLARDVGFVTGMTLRDFGIDVVLAPVLDVNNNPANPVINTRSFGSDTDTVGRIAVALARGLREAGAIPVIKHFPGHGDTNVDSHLALPTIRKDVDELERMELVPFRRAIAEGAEVVMTAHILYPKIDPERPATLSPKILGDILRKRLGFQGIVMTDAMEMYAVARRYPYDQSVRMAVQAGVDVVLLTGLGPYVDTMYRSLLTGFRSGELPMELLDRAVDRQLMLKIERGLFVRHSGTRPAPTEVEQRWHKEREATVAARYVELRRRYARRGTSLSIEAAREGVAALRRPYAGRPKGTVVRVFAASALVRTAALSQGISKQQVVSGGVAAASRAVKQRGAGASNELWLVEVRLRDRGAWNRLVGTLGEAGPQLVALYPDNPFVDLAIPKRGAVLASFTPTKESREALVYRALQERPVAAARLVLPSEGSAR